jgi:hypothetical protein
MPTPIDESEVPSINARPSLIEAWRRALTERRWWRSTFTRAKLAEAAKNLAWVGPLTILIWVWAEREQTQDRVIGDVTMQVTSSDRSLSIKQSPGFRTQLTLRGPVSGLDKVQEQLSAGIPRGIEIDIGNSLGRGTGQPINIVDRIQNQSVFKDNGVSITKAEPPEIRVDVDTMKTVELEVQIPPRVKNLTPETTFDPRTVKVTGPETLLSRLQEQSQFVVQAQIANSDALRGPPGKHEIGSVAVDLPVREPGDNVSINPSSVHATLYVRPADVELKKDSVPITIEATPSFNDTYRVDLHGNESVANVIVTGPQEQINLIQQGQWPIFARLYLTKDDYGQEAPKQLKIDLPDGVKLEGPPRMADFKIVKRENPGG